MKRAEFKKLIKQGLSEIKKLKAIETKHVVAESKTKPVYKGAKAIIAEADLIVDTYKKN